MADAIPAAPVADTTTAPAAAAPITNIVADATPPVAAASSLAAPVLAVAAIDPVEARTYLAAHGMTAEDAAKVPDTDLAKKYEDAKTAEANKPITYTDFKLPEGVKLEEKSLSEIKSDFATAKLTQAQAQTFLDKHVAAMQAVSQQNIALFNKMQTDWQSEIKADPQFGGTNFEAKTIPAIAKAITTFGGDVAGQKALREAVSLTGMGNNPQYVKFMARIGAALMEGEPAGGKPLSGKAAQRDFDAIASNMYPSQSTQTQ